MLFRFPICMVRIGLIPALDRYGEIMKSLLALAFLAVSGSAAASEPAEAMPAQFIGEWNAVVADCGTGNNDSVLEIKSSHISYWESDGPIKAIVVHGRYEVALIVELSGEGQTWLTTAQFKLSPGGDKLVSTSDPGNEFVRYRCPRSG